MSDPATFYFTQGVLGVTVIVLGLVVRALWLELKAERAEKIAILKAWQQETKEEGKVSIEALQGSSQAITYIAGKIEAAKKGTL